MKRTICLLSWQWRQLRQAPPQYLRPPHPVPLADRGVELGQTDRVHRRMGAATIAASGFKIQYCTLAPVSRAPEDSVALGAAHSSPR